MSPAKPVKLIGTKQCAFTSAENRAATIKTNKTKLLLNVSSREITGSLEIGNHAFVLCLTCVEMSFGAAR